jgi:hypothetical protein
MSDNSPVEGYIYLLKMCDTNRRIIYKPGKSINFYKRFKKYYYAEILTFIVSDDITKDENEIIKLFNNNCKLDTGREFFLAKDDNFVLKLFMDYFSSKIDRSIETSNSITSVNNIVSEPIVTENIVPENTDTDIETVIEPVVEPVVDIIIEYICPNINCNKKFDYCSYLKKHLVNSYHCNKTIENIDSYILEIKEINEIKKTNIVKTLKVYKCSNCKHNYQNNFTLHRHMNNSKCTKYIQKH